MEVGRDEDAVRELRPWRVEALLIVDGPFEVWRVHGLILP
jgi:hypothetical protein